MNNEQEKALDNYILLTVDGKRDIDQLSSDITKLLGIDRYEAFGYVLKGLSDKRINTFYPPVAYGYMRPRGFNGNITSTAAPILIHQYLTIEEAIEKTPLSQRHVGTVVFIGTDSESEDYVWCGIRDEELKKID